MQLIDEAVHTITLAGGLEMTLADEITLNGWKLTEKTLLNSYGMLDVPNGTTYLAMGVRPLPQFQICRITAVATGTEGTTNMFVRFNARVQTSPTTTTGFGSSVTFAASAASRGTTRNNGEDVWRSFFMTGGIQLDYSYEDFSANGSAEPEVSLFAHAYERSLQGPTTADWYVVDGSGDYKLSGLGGTGSFTTMTRYLGAVGRGYVGVSTRPGQTDL